MLRVAVIELPARFGDVEAALADVEATLERGPASDLAVLPECSLTGYVDAVGHCDPTSFAEPIDGPTMTKIAALARTYDTAIGAPLIEQAGDAVYNAYVVVGRDGAVLHRYRKRHPWFPERWATPGDVPPSSFELGGVSIAVAICFDVHFLADESADVLSRTDALLFPSAWVDPDRVDLRAEIFDTLAAKFGISIVNANWGPGTPLVRGQGASRVVQHSGEIVQLPMAFGPQRVDVTLSPRRISQPR
ncbi:MAG: carbon-nitrogen hydrolase family protein [Polyangiaceae bacterium]|nr:carbon-nitrogen hydrolase family protein [Polyangiaceae bacterium]